MPDSHSRYIQGNRLRKQAAGSGIITVRINRCGCGRISGTVDNGCGRCYNDTGDRNPESDVCADEYLGITFSSDEGGAYNSGENK